MSDYALFQIWGPFRRSLIHGHRFYVEQARKRLLSQFGDIEAEADRAAEEWLERNGANFDPDRHDEGDFYEAANDAGIEFYSLLTGMRDQTRLRVLAGMFHEWDKHLRAWLVQEMRHWHRGDHAVAKVWSVDFTQIADLLECLGWKIRSSGYFPALDACRLVVNVHKHGEGRSLDEIRQQFPEYLDDPFAGAGGGFSDVKYRDHTHLKVTDAQFQIFADAIEAFWEAVPENIYQSDVTDLPEWLKKAILKDRASQGQAAQK
ncbi:MAG: hypothetical protein M3Q08_02315 [Pseudomonadota bacterium]|nr:hypothetical protein [Pseudomonadota bacterium]